MLFEKKLDVNSQMIKNFELIQDFYLYYMPSQLHITLIMKHIQRRFFRELKPDQV